MPIFNLEIPTRISLTMADTLFGAVFRVWPVNWRLVICEEVEQASPNIGRIPFYLSPFILHIYKHDDYIKEDEEDLLTITAEKVTYKVCRNPR